MKLTEPKVDIRAEQSYMGIRTQVPMSELPTVIPQFIDEVFGWLGAQDVPPAGAPFIRFHVINMEAKLDVEIGVPVASTPKGDDRVRGSVLPAGRYASLIYTGVANAVPANAALIDWIAGQGLVMDRWDVPEGDAFAGRYEIFLTGPDDDPDPANWDSEVAFRLKD